MDFSLAWLADYVDLPADVAELARRLTAAGLAVEGVAAHGDDTILDLDVTTNRPDAMNHLGVAREIAVLTGKPLRLPEASVHEGAERIEEAASVAVDDLAACPRFAARLIRGVRVGPSPAWLRARLESIGLRSINNVVDVTNFVLRETGQPQHAYDFAKLAGRRLAVRQARAGETLTTLDGVLRQLDPAMLVIADAERPVGLAGVMGGLDSEVTEATTDVLLESAHFDRRAVRQAARRLGMHTDASHRFERGADPGACAAAVDRGAALIAEVAGGTALAGAIDVRDEKRSWQRRGWLELAKLNAFAGVEIGAAEVERWLRGLGFEVMADGRMGRPGGVGWEVLVPSWRYYDFQPRPSGEVYPADLYEEVVRIHGFDAIPAALPAIPGADAPKGPALVRRARVQRFLAAAGYAEAIHYSFLDPAVEGALPNLAGGLPALRLANPISEQYSVLRRSLLPNLLEGARFNQRRGTAAVRLFEVGTVFFGDGARGDRLPDQPEHVAIVGGGRAGNDWQREVEIDLFDLKGVVEALADSFGVPLEFCPADLPGLLAGNAAELRCGGREGRVVGCLGRVDAADLYPLYAAELALDALSQGTIDLRVEIPSRFPGVAVDFTLLHPLSVSWRDLDGAIRELAAGELASHELKVRYRGQGVPEGAVKTTISFLYQARERSLTQDEVNALHFALCGELERRFGWKG
jgi:phenylalanyl-tRNA synthetase beta chain